MTTEQKIILHDALDHIELVKKRINAPYPGGGMTKKEIDELLARVIDDIETVLK